MESSSIAINATNVPKHRCCCHDGSGHYTQPYLHLLVIHPPITFFLSHKRPVLVIGADLLLYSRYLVDECHNVVLSNCKKRHHASFKKDIPLTYTTLCHSLNQYNNRGECDAVVGVVEGSRRRESKGRKGPRGGGGRSFRGSFRGRWCQHVGADSRSCCIIMV